MVAGQRGINPAVETENLAIQPVQRIRLTFSKEGSTRYISHLDLARAMERALNRADLPVAYTQGFNRRPRLSLAAALPLGYTSEAEIADVWLVESIAPDEFMRRLAVKMPAGIAVREAEEIPLSAPSTQRQLAESVYTVRFLDPINKGALRAVVEEAMQMNSLIVEKTKGKGKRAQSVDLRPLILDMALKTDEGVEPVLHLRLVQTATQTGRPDDVLAALGLDPLDMRVHRVALVFAP